MAELQRRANEIKKEEEKRHRLRAKIKVRQTRTPRQRAIVDRKFFTGKIFRWLDFCLVLFSLL